MTVLDETYAPAGGVEMSKPGLGTCFIDDDRAAPAVRAAVEFGYRNTDTAQAYGKKRCRRGGAHIGGAP
jgi:diketogulonate reductase-like aldo/keto reductase